MTNRSNIRVAVVGENETSPLREYVQRSGEAAREPCNETHFRQVERHYKQRYPSPPDFSTLLNGQDSNARLSSLFPGLQISILPLVPIMAASQQESLSEDLKANIDYVFGALRSPNLRIIEHRDFPGFKLIPNPFRPSFQKQVLIEVFKTAINPPSVSNLDEYYEVPSRGLWPLLCLRPGEQQQGSIKRKNNKSLASEQQAALPADQVIKKLRWVALGYDYDWTTKAYKWDTQLIAFPQFLHKLTTGLAYYLGWTDYNPQAGIINYYQVKDTLTGHVDRSEKNSNAPLVSLSFGLAAVFLLGKETREDAVLPIKLTSGDVLILSGPSRRFYHGVPRIIENSFPFDIFNNKDESLMVNQSDWSVAFFTY